MRLTCKLNTEQQYAEGFLRVSTEEHLYVQIEVSRVKGDVLFQNDMLTAQMGSRRCKGGNFRL